MITASPTATLGSVTTLDHYSPSDFSSSDVVLCRITAPLIALAFGLIQRGVGCRVLGREIGTSLVTLVKACKTSDIKELEEKLIHRRNREVAKARATGSESAVAAIEDKYDCLNIFLQNHDDVEELCEDIMALFDDKVKGLLTLSTIHKAKGLEWPTVFILDWKLLPSKWATQPWQQAQERNLQYVAVTRAKLDLKFITSNCWRKEGVAKCQTESFQAACNPLPTFDPAVDTSPSPFDLISNPDAIASEHSDPSCFTQQHPTT